MFLNEKCFYKSASVLADANFHLSSWRTLGLPEWFDLAEQALSTCSPIKPDDFLFEI